MKRHSRFHRLYDLFKGCFGELGYQVEGKRIETLTNHVFVATENRARSYHSTEHVFDVSAGLGPLQGLAAIYHDCIYLQVDREIPGPWRKGLEPIFEAPSLSARAVKATEPGLAELCNELFGLASGERRPGPKMNEYLSVQVAMKELGPILTEKDLLALCVFIELTRPFRGISSKGQTPAQRLGEVLRSYFRRNPTLPFALAESEIERMLQLGVEFANHDVGNFASKNPAGLVTGSWSLLPEVAPELKNASICPVSAWGRRLRESLSFTLHLKVETIFQAYGGYPSARELEKLLDQTRSNIAVSSFYLSLRILAVDIIEALYRAQGRDPLVSAICGDSRQGGFEEYLPRAKRTGLKGYNATEKAAIRMLTAGLGRDFWFDRFGSRLACFLALRIPRRKLLEIIAASGAWDPKSEPAWLGMMPKTVMAEIRGALRVVDPV